MPSIEIIDLTNTQDTLQGILQQEYELTDQYDGNLATVVLAAGRTEEVGDQLYRVIDGDLPVTDAAIADGKVYIHLKALTATTAEATLEVDPGTFDPNKGGFYTVGGEKVIYAMTKDTGVYSNKGRMLTPQGYDQQLGQIFPVHPDVKKLPNPYNFSKCDGVELMPTVNFDTGNDTNVPDLTDERFLQGATTYARTGSNTKNLEHNHGNTGSNLGDHNHQWHISNGTGVSNQSYNPSGAVTNFSVNASASQTSSGAIGGADKDIDKYLTNNYYTSNTNLAHDHSTSNALSSTQDFRPQYFNVLYYMRIN
jgi:hypothetical protein